MTKALTLHPENEYVFIEEMKVKQTKTESGLYIAEVKQFKDTLEGKIVAVSENSTRPLHVKVGDTVYFTEVGVKSRTTVDGKTYAIMKETDILGYIRED